MIRKLGSIWLMSLFSWNVLLGASGGILLCLHEDVVGHEASCNDAETCCGDAKPVIDIHSNSDCGDCIDVEIEGMELTSLRPDKHELIQLPVCLLAFDVSHDQVSLYRAEFLNEANPRAPPQIPSKSVEIAQTIVLRI